MNSTRQLQPDAKCKSSDGSKWSSLSMSTKQIVPPQKTLKSGETRGCRANTSVPVVRKRNELDQHEHDLRIPFEIIIPAARSINLQIAEAFWFEFPSSYKYK